jgi:hypothetical protein
VHLQVVRNTLTEHDFKDAFKKFAEITDIVCAAKHYTKICCSFCNYILLLTDKCVTDKLMYVMDKEEYNGVWPTKCNSINKYITYIYSQN